MLRLRTLGGLSIKVADGVPSAAGPTFARRGLALLAVLAAHGDRGVSRDKLMAMFWPESDMERARQSLYQTIYELRRGLRSEELLLGRDELTLNPEVIGSDIGELESALARGDRARAVELYAGPFLDGVHVSGAPDFEHWVDGERAYVAHAIEGSLEALANEAASRGDRRAALAWWRRLAAMDPRKTGVVVALMKELAATGDRAGAIRQAEIYHALVQDDLELDPNPAVEALATRLKREAPAIPTAPPATTHSEDAHHVAQAVAPGRTLAGRFVIEREIGRGGSATVYLARDVQHDRRVAVKVLHSEFAIGVGVERFRQEIAVTANLQHPHILPIHESREEGGRLFFVMPYVEGESLRDRLDRERRLEVPEAIRLAREVADALAYAHERGIVHRDIKPENILLTSGHAVVADFGLALALSEARGQRRTMSGTVVGTPTYLSPEQASGGRTADTRSDQYSLAYMLYEMLAGETPFRADDVRELIVQRIVDSPPLLRTRRPEAPEAVERAIDRALSSDPSERFENITAFASALTAPAPLETRKLVRDWWHARSVRSRAGWSAVALVLVLSGSAAWRITRARAPLAQRAWVLPADFVNRTGDSVFDQSLDAALAVGLQQSAYVNVYPRARVAQTLARMQRPVGKDRLDENLAREVAQRDGVGAVLSSAIDRIDSSYVVTMRLIDPTSGVALAGESGVAHRKSDVLDVLGSLLTRLRGDIGESRAALRKHDLPLPRATTRSLEALREYAEGDVAYNGGRHDLAVQLWQRAVQLDSDFALAHASLGNAFYWSNNRPQGDLHFDRALALLDRLTTRERFIIGSVVQSARGNRQTAIELRRALLSEYPDDPEEWAAQAYDLMRLERYAESIEAQKRRLLLEPGSASGFINLATAYGGLGAYDQAVVNYQRAFALQHDMLTNGNINGEYGTVLVLMGRYADARAAFDSMMHGTAYQQALGHRSIAMLAMYQGRYAEAIEHFRAAVMLHHADHAAQSEVRTRLLLAAAEEEKGWRDSVDYEADAAYKLFKSSYLEPAFLLWLGRRLAPQPDLARAHEVLDSLTRRARPDNPRDQSDRLTVAGEIALAEGRADSAVQLMTMAYASDSTTLKEESLARAFAAAKNIPAATRTYEALIERRRSWYGWEPELRALTAPLAAGRLFEQMGADAQARRVYEQMLNQWRDGDSDLVDLREARQRLALVSQRMSRTAK